MFGDGAVEAVLNGQDAEVDRTGLDGFAGLGGEGAGSDFSGEARVLCGHGIERGDVRVGAEFALDGDLRCRFRC